MKNFLSEHWIDTLLNGYGIWIITGVLAALFIASVVLLIFFSKRESKLKKELAENNTIPKNTQPDADSLAAAIVPVQEENTVEEAEKAAETETAEAPQEETPKAKDKTGMKQKKEKTMKNEVKSTAKPEEKTSPKKNTYRVTYDSDRKLWVVKKDGSTRASRLADTKEEALKIAEELAENSGANLSVHKKNGKFQKQ